MISQIPVEYTGLEAYLDCEEFHGAIIVLDVLFVGFPLIHLTLTQRLAKLESPLVKQNYYMLNQLKDVPCNEGYIIQRDSAPYGGEVFRVKLRETGDFLVKDGKIWMGLPCPRSFPCYSDLVKLEGKIVEVYLDTFLVKCVRYDKQTANSSVIVARCMSEYRVSADQLRDKCSSIKSREDDSRENLLINRYSIWTDSEYGKNVRVNIPKVIKSPYTEDELKETSGNIDKIIDSLKGDLDGTECPGDLDIDSGGSDHIPLTYKPLGKFTDKGKKGVNRKGNSANRKRKKDKKK